MERVSLLKVHSGGAAAAGIHPWPEMDKKRKKNCDCERVHIEPKCDQLLTVLISAAGWGGVMLLKHYYLLLAITKINIFLIIKLWNPL